jgi:hypothetical protein
VGKPSSGSRGVPIAITVVSGADSVVATTVVEVAVEVGGSVVLVEVVDVVVVVVEVVVVVVVAGGGEVVGVPPAASTVTTTVSVRTAPPESRTSRGNWYWPGPVVPALTVMVDVQKSSVPATGITSEKVTTSPPVG